MQKQIRTYYRHYIKSIFGMFFWCVTSQRSLLSVRLSVYYSVCIILSYYYHSLFRGKELKKVLEKSASTLDVNDPNVYPGFGIQITGLRLEIRYNTSIVNRSPKKTWHCRWSFVRNILYFKLKLNLSEYQVFLGIAGVSYKWLMLLLLLFF